MSILIKGIDMPKDCDDCMFNFYREVDTCPTCYLTKHIVIRKKEENIPTDCPLVEIPTPHGRLIDGDKLSIEFENQCAGECADCMFEERCVIIDRIAPTILEAEE